LERPVEASEALKAKAQNILQFRHREERSDAAIQRRRRISTISWIASLMLAMAAC
jgi:hypothetical protein